MINSKKRNKNFETSSVLLILLKQNPSYFSAFPIPFLQQFLKNPIPFQRENKTLYPFSLRKTIPTEGVTLKDCFPIDSDVSLIPSTQRIVIKFSRDKIKPYSAISWSWSECFRSIKKSNAFVKQVLLSN